MTKKRNMQCLPVATSLAQNAITGANLVTKSADCFSKGKSEEAMVSQQLLKLSLQATVSIANLQDTEQLTAERRKETLQQDSQHNLIKEMLLSEEGSPKFHSLKK